MSRTIVSLLLTLTLAACSPQASPAPDATRLLQRIPAADAAKYRKLDAKKTWQNPYLVIRDNGVGLLDAGNNEEHILKIDEVLNALAQLPSSAWPYGRVVAVQDAMTAETDEQQVAARRTRGILGGTLEEAHIAVVWIPAGKAAR